MVIEMLLKFGDFDITPYIVEDGYDPTPNRRTDVDSYQDAVEGKLHRTTLKHTRSSITVEIGSMYENTHNAFMAKLVSNYINYSERDATVTYYDTESCSLKTGHMYIDANQKFGKVIKEINGQKYMSGFTMELVEY